MDKFEYKIRAEEIKELISREEYARAAEIADTIDWRRVKSVMMLCTISDLYKINRRYEDARDILLLAYDRRPEGRTICYSLCELSIKMDEIAQAKDYLDEFIRIAPKDPGRYVLQYKLYEALGVSVEERIEVLVKLKEQDPRERWQYELAYLYHKIGLETQCVEECDELILWFGDGRYVMKAMELKMLHQPLSPQQQEIYDAYRAELEKPAQPEYTPVEPKTVVFEDVPIQVKTMDDSPYNTINLQAELAQDLEKVLSNDYRTEESVMDDITKVIISPMLEPDIREEIASEEAQAETGEVQWEYTTEELEAVEPPVAESEDIRYQTVDFSSMDVLQAMQAAEEAEQARIRESVREAVEAARAAVEEITAEETVSAEEDVPVEETATEDVATESESFEGTDEAEAVAEIAVPEAEATPEEAEEIQEPEAEESSSQVKDDTGEMVMEQLRLRHTDMQMVQAEPPKSMARVLSQEADGQLTLMVPEEKEYVEKQITGQLNLNDILLEWERLKKENEEKRKEDVRQHVLRQTGSMFTEFEASMRDGLLERLESGEVSMDRLEDEIALAGDAATEEAVAFAEVSGEEMPETDEAQEATEASDELTEATEPELTSEDEVVTEEVPEDEVMTEDGLEEEIPAEEAFAEDVSEAADVSEEEPVEDSIEETETETDTEENFTEEESSEESTLETGETEEATLEETGAESLEEAEESIGKESEEEIPETAPATEPAAPVKQEVEREKAKPRVLTREERDLFGPFIPNKESRDQLLHVLDSVSLASFTGNLIITGEEGIDIITLAKNIVVDLRDNDSNFSGKIAKISGGVLNDRNVEETLQQMENGALIIHGASDMKADTINRMHRILQQQNFGIVVVLEDTKPAMNRLLKLNPILNESFSTRMDVEALSNDLLVGYGKKYALDLEYFIDDLGTLALHTKIESMQTSDHMVTTAEVRAIVDEAINRVNRKNIGHFFDILLAKRYNAEDMVILTEKDFNW